MYQGTSAGHEIVQPVLEVDPKTLASLPCQHLCCCSQFQACAQEPKGVCIAAESLHNWDPQAMLQLREAWPYAVCLTPAHIVGLTLQELSQLWQVRLLLALPCCALQLGRAPVPSLVMLS